MSQDVIESLQILCDRLRDKLMQQPEYRALKSLEKTIEEISACMGSLGAEAPAPDFSAPPMMEPRGLDASSMSMHQGAAKVADVLADALMERKHQPRSTADHLPSHRVA
ncbi:MAG: hypothetical protein K2X62_15885 [Beijerinckiaceae bacterium]|jgi:hypothetical protein|nr:hypothetical protein [Beijerinckiaceae bacterium]MDO9440553.1 hypothetical protein [Beijerinckiaceae bacterium]